uniref:Uncharacterized protein n=1 Tax=Fervidicoccus fontis TaxID=683846 RepID=A0A7J3ZJX6_9CREN
MEAPTGAWSTLPPPLPLGWNGGTSRAPFFGPTAQPHVGVKVECNAGWSVSKSVEASHCDLLSLQHRRAGGGGFLSRVLAVLALPVGFFETRKTSSIDVHWALKVLSISMAFRLLSTIALYASPQLAYSAPSEMAIRASSSLLAPVLSFSRNLRTDVVLQHAT